MPRVDCKSRCESSHAIFGIFADCSFKLLMVIKLGCSRRSYAWITGAGCATGGGGVDFGRWVVGRVFVGAGVGAGAFVCG